MKIPHPLTSRHPDGSRDPAEKKERGKGKRIFLKKARKLSLDLLAWLDSGSSPECPLKGEVKKKGKKKNQKECFFVKEQKKYEEVFWK